ncbi:DUF1697 domain-containing protein [Cellulophaga baltica]|uniref:DUF1697 domain-containing protein n=1 Tax=Cellulophaga TaxID=104264 RepID=UPI001C06677D|nr:MULTISPECIES: DUF1697 domain-containing protein [Cellulophaga]MBU2995513.1 DUF1697 domain-containing protein [Cellulophaga baltica]MDO6766907.1 DUF1697 domain-containing protein [Cellulophaga sp. 1_MG-2023]
MKTYILLLRGVNVAGKNKMPMASLKLLLEGLNISEIQTYIQSGNVVFKSTESLNTLEVKISKAIGDIFNFKVPILLIEASKFKSIIEKAIFSEVENTNSYFVLLKNKAAKKHVSVLNSENYENESFIITDNCVYLSCKKGYGRAKCNNNFFEKKLKVQATTRNFKTMYKLLEMSN